MICKNCGTTLPDIAKFCFICGKTITPLDDNSDEKNIDDNADSDAVSTENNDSADEHSADKEREDVAESEAKEEQESAPKEVDGEENVEEEADEVVEDNVANEEAVAEQTTETENSQTDSSDKKTKDSDESKETKESKDSSEDKSLDDKKDSVTQDDEEEKEEKKEKKDTNTGGYRIMVNPDYVPPEIPEEKPLFVEHIDYQSIYAKKAEKIEKILLRVGTVVGILAVAAGIGFAGYKLYNSHQFNSVMDTARNQYNAGNYEQAITTLNDAKQMKGADENEVVSLLADVYVDMDDYDTAMQEILKVYNQTGDADLYKKYQSIKEDADAYNFDEEDIVYKDEGSDEFQELISQARELVSSGDYDGAIEKCKEAGKIDDTLESVYLVYATAYANKNNYEMAVTILDKGITTLNEKAGKSVSNDYRKLLKKYKSVGERLEEYSDLMKNLYKSMGEVVTINSVKNAVDILTSDDYSDASAISHVTYYTEEKGFTDSISEGKGMAVYNNGYVYYGDFKDGKRVGNGIFMAASNEDDNIKYNLYKGEWSNNLPEGKGTIIYVENFSTDDMAMSVTTGTFKAGYEDGKMNRNKTVAGTKWGNMEYSVKKGVPVALKDDKGKVIATPEGKAVLGYHFFNDRPTHIITIVEGALFGVEGLGLSMTQ